jgi:hypothetical protein
MANANNFLTPAAKARDTLTVAGTPAAGIGTPFPIGVKTPLLGVFLCPSFLHRVFLRLVFVVMVGRIGQASAWPFPVGGSSNPLRSATQRLRPMGGGLSDFAQETPR